MRYVGRALVALVAGLAVSGCLASRGPSAPATSTYTVDEHGNVKATARAATEALPGDTGPQEIFGAALPLGPEFMLKAGLLWSGNPWFWSPAPQRVVVPAQAAPCVQESYRTETYTEMVPVQRTRQVPVRRVTLPVPQAAPQCMAPSVGGAPCWECGQK